MLFNVQEQGQVPYTPDPAKNMISYSSFMHVLLRISKAAALAIIIMFILILLVRSFGLGRIIVRYMNRNRRRAGNNELLIENQ